MAEYIDREAAIAAAEHAYDEWNLAMAAADGKREINLVFKRQELCKAVASVFTGAPAADVTPVTHGRWEPFGGKYISRKKCSHCGWDGQEGIGFYRWCPNCGAKMNLDGGADDAAD